MATYCTLGIKVEQSSITRGTEGGDINHVLMIVDDNHKTYESL